MGWVTKVCLKCTVHQISADSSYLPPVMLSLLPLLTSSGNLLASVCSAVCEHSSAFLAEIWRTENCLHQMFTEGRIAQWQLSQSACFRSAAALAPRLQTSLGHYSMLHVQCAVTQRQDTKHPGTRWPVSVSDSRKRLGFSFRSYWFIFLNTRFDTS